MHIVIVGAAGFPIGMAAIEKTRLLAKSILDAEEEASVTSRKGVHPTDKGIDFPPVGQFEGIDYYYTSGSIYRPSGFFKRALFKIKGTWGEARLLRRLKKANRLDATIVYSKDFIPFIFYWLLSRIYGYKFLYLLAEHSSTTTSRRAFHLRLSDKLVENLGLRMCDGILPISQYLIDFGAQKAPGVPYLKIPVLTEFSRFNRPKSPEREKFFLYCGSVAYLDVIYFLLEVFERLPEDENLRLFLVIGGDKEGKDSVAERIGQMKKSSQVRIFSRLPYDDLVQLYIDAIGLLIPLRHTPQDTARFPHKIGEYLASRNPLITTRVGEIPNYFTDNGNAFVTEDYDVEEFVNKMQFIIDHPDEAKAIGERGWETGKENFDYALYGPPLIDFIKSLQGDSEIKEYA